MIEQKVSMIKKLKVKKEQLNARIKIVENREKYKARKLMARRNMLVGTYFIEKAEKNGTMDEIITLMNQYLKRKSDRMLFDLQPLTTKK